MKLGVCHCQHFAFIYEPVSTIPMAIELLFICFLIPIGIIQNYQFRKKLKIEKRNRPLGRKGNVIEPIMSWFCCLQMIGFPYRLIFRWVLANEVVPFDMIPEWLCVLLTLIDRSISFCAAYNSLFVALIRYVYIVHDHQANQWEFEKVGTWFKIASIAFPIGMEIACSISYSFGESPLSHESLKIGVETLDGCADIFTEANVTYALRHQKVVNASSGWTPIIRTIFKILSYFYVIISVAVALNLIEAVLYCQIFSTIKR